VPSDDILYPPSAGRWVHVVRQEGREEHVCGVYSTIDAARANSHRHQWNTDEIVSFVLDQTPELIGPDGLRVDNPSM